jgi:hypothetical protein
MDERRFQELEAKRDTEGLTVDEANELGRMMAERQGKPYGNAETRRETENAEGLDEAAKRGEEAGQDGVNQPTGDKAEPADADRPVVGTAGSGYVPPANTDPDRDGAAPSKEGTAGTPGANPS